MGETLGWCGGRWQRKKHLESFLIASSPCLSCFFFFRFSFFNILCFPPFLVCLRLCDHVEGDAECKPSTQFPSISSYFQRRRQEEKKSQREEEKKRRREEEKKRRREEEKNRRREEEKKKRREKEKKRRRRKDDKGDLFLKAAWLERRLGRNFWPHFCRKFRPILALCSQGVFPLRLQCRRAKSFAQGVPQKGTWAKLFGTTKSFAQGPCPKGSRPKLRPRWPKSFAQVFWDRPRLVNFRLSSAILGETFAQKFRPSGFREDLGRNYFAQVVAEGTLGETFGHRPLAPVTWAKLRKKFRPSAGLGF